MQVKKQQLELGLEQQTGYKSGKEYVRAVYCHPALIFKFVYVPILIEPMIFCYVFCVWFKLLLLDPHTDFSGGR